MVPERTSYVQLWCRERHRSIFEDDSVRDDHERAKAVRRDLAHEHVLIGGVVGLTQLGGEQQRHLWHAISLWVAVDTVSIVDACERVPGAAGGVGHIERCP